MSGIFDHNLSKEKNCKCGIQCNSRELCHSRWIWNPSLGGWAANLLAEILWWDAFGRAWGGVQEVSIASQPHSESELSWNERMSLRENDNGWYRILVEWYNSSLERIAVNFKDWDLCITMTEKPPKLESKEYLTPTETNQSMAQWNGPHPDSLKPHKATFRVGGFSVT